jgi:predicted nucleotidyltransferase
MNSNKLIAYALDFTSFLLQKTNYKEEIINVILFGSVSRGEAGKESDVDLFLDTVKDNPKLEKECTKILNDFEKSVKYKNYWKPLGVSNQIKLSIGILNNWKSLKPSIIANGITLYGKFKSEIKEGKHETFFIWENIQPNSTRVLINKQLNGFVQNNKFYEGMVQKYDGERLGKGCIVVPLEHSNLFLKYFHKYNIPVKIKRVMEY